MAVTLLVLALVQIVPVAISQVTPLYQYQDGKIVPVNGSVQNGGCLSTVIIGNGIITCADPITSVLFDGNVPTLTGLDGDMWASRLLTLQTATDNCVPLVFDFTAIPDYSGVEEVEVVMFNCPQWGISADFISVLAGTFSTNNPPQITNISPTITSCDYLVRVCISVSTTQQALRFEFSSRVVPFWVHLAEMKIYSNSGMCAPDIIITPPTTSPPATSVMAMTSPTTPTMIPTITPVPTSATRPSSLCSSCTSTAVLSSVLTAIITALLATLIFVLVQIAVCKCHPKFRCGGAETVASAGGEGQEYEEVDIDKGGASEGGSGPTHMEVRGGGGGNIFVLKENEAYGTHT